MRRGSFMMWREVAGVSFVEATTNSGGSSERHITRMCLVPVVHCM